MRTPSSLFAITIALSSVGCAGAGLSANGWNVVRTKHLSVYTPESERDYQQTVAAAEDAYAALTSAFFKDVDLGGPVEVVFLSEANFQGVFGYERSAAAMPSAPGGGAIGKNGLVVINEDREGQSAAEMMTHLFLHKMSAKAPLWLHEGLAAYLRSFEMKEGNGQRAACFGKPGGEPKSYVPLGEMFSLNWDQYAEGPRSWYKHTARTLVDYVMHGSGGKNMEKMAEIMSGLLEGKASDQVLTGALGGSVDDLNKKVVEHGNEVGHAAGSGTQLRGLCPLPFPVPADRSPDAGPWKTEPASAAQIATLIDGLKKLPRPEGYPSWYPPEVMSRGGAPAAQ